MNGLKMLVEKIEEKAFSRQTSAGIKEPSTSDMYIEKFTVREIEEMVKQVEDELNPKKEKTTFEVGEIVELMCDIYGVITNVNEEWKELSVVWTDGLVDRVPFDGPIKKTGKRIDVKLFLTQIMNNDNSGWIPVENELPDGNRSVIPVIVSTKKYAYAFQTTYIKDEECFAIDDDDEVIAWMPWPEKYKPNKN